MSKVYVLLHDRDKKNNPYPFTFYEQDANLFHEQNAKGWGVYRAVNDFEATDEQMKIAGAKTKRNIAFLQKINAVFADLDIAKAGDGQTREQKEEKKETLLFALYEKLPPSRIIDTSNGIQPLWDLKDSDTTPEYQSRYVAVINSIIEWSKQHGAMGDAVKDVTRIIRLPDYDHMKEEPYPVTSKYNDNFIYTLEEIEAKFPPVKVEATPAQLLHARLDDLSRAIDMIDFQDLIRRAFASIGRSAEFDNTGRLILDGRQTGTFQGRKDDRNYLASSSHEPFKGNRITAVADIKGITNKEARAWIIEEFGLKKFNPKIKESVKIEPLSGYAVDKVVKIFTWGTPNLDKEITPMTAGQINLITGNTGMGKTTFSFDVAQKNANLGHRVLYISLEQSRQGIIDRISRSYSGITKNEWRDRSTIPENKKIRFRQKVSAIDNIHSLILYGFGKDIEPTTDNIFAVITEIKPDLVFIDNYDDITKDQKNEYGEQNRVIKELKTFAETSALPINILHHRNAKKKGGGIGDIRGSGKITDTAWTVLTCAREWDADATAVQNASFVIRHEKDRDFGTFNMAVVYWQNGTFNDEFIS